MLRLQKKGEISGGGGGTTYRSRMSFEFRVHFPQIFQLRLLHVAQLGHDGVQNGRRMALEKEKTTKVIKYLTFHHTERDFSPEKRTIQQLRRKNQPFKWKKTVNRFFDFPVSSE